MRCWGKPKSCQSAGLRWLSAPQSALGGGTNELSVKGVRSQAVQPRQTPGKYLRNFLGVLPRVRCHGQSPATDRHLHTLPPGTGGVLPADR